MAQTVSRAVDSWAASDTDVGAVEAAAAGVLDPGALVTHRFPLERLAEALDATRDKPPGFVKAWVACG